MLQIEKILLPVDFSPRSTVAANYAKALACRYRSEVTLLHVLSHFDYALGSLEAAAPPPEWYFSRREDARKRLDQFLAEELRTLPVRRLVLEGDAAQEIVQLAHAERMNLIVIPTHGYGPFRRFLLGSVAAKVLHDADCPVLTGAHIPEAPPSDLLVRSVVCAVDFGPQSAKALSWAAQMASEFQARLTLVHVLPRVDSGDFAVLSEEMTGMLMRQAREQMAELQARTGAEGEVLIDSGDIAQVVRKAVESRQAGLLVIGRHDDIGKRGRMRANVYAIVRESPCPVVSV